MATSRFKPDPDAYAAMRTLQAYVDRSSLPKHLQELVKLRASGINGCAYCLDMHAKDALALGLPIEKIYMLNAWEEAHCYDQRERAALAWTDALTRVADGHVPDAVYEAVRQHFAEQELNELTLAVVTINAWNRLAISARAEPGHYRSRYAPEAAGSAT